MPGSPERHVDGFRAAGADDVAIVVGPAGRDVVRGAAARRWSVPSARPGSSSSGRARSRWRRRATGGDLVAAAGGGRRASRSPTTATRPTSWRSPAPGRVLGDVPDLPSRQRAAALAGGGRRLRGRRPAPAMAARGRHRWAARPRPRSAPAGQARRSTSRRSGRAIAARPGRRRRPARRAAGRRADVGGDAGLARAARRRRGRGRCIEERGLRTGVAPASGRRRRVPRARSLDRDGPGSFGEPPRPLRRRRDRRHARPPGPPVRARTRRAGRRPRTASPRTCCSPTRIADPWLRGADGVGGRGARSPILLGGHTLVGPGLRLVARRQRRGRAPWR